MPALYVLDATLDRGDGIHCFCPVDVDEKGEVTHIVVGMNYLSPDPPGKLLGVVHSDGQEAVEAWCSTNADEYKRLAAL